MARSANEAHHAVGRRSQKELLQLRLAVLDLAGAANALRAAAPATPEWAAAVDALELAALRCSLAEMVLHQTEEMSRDLYRPEVM